MNFRGERLKLKQSAKSSARDVGGVPAIQPEGFFRELQDAAELVLFVRDIASLARTPRSTISGTRKPSS